MKKILILMSLLIIFIMSTVIIAQEEEDTSYTSGTVVKITGSQITISELNDNDEKVNVVYQTDKTTKFVNVNSLKEVPVGKEVEIEYVEVKNKKTAKTITLVQEESDDDSGSDDQGSDDSEGDDSY
ncbi:MAG: hypothetical protein KKH98_14025 [Spirochaetes bacterium]|nr:hypothetical protein [Spirochaetota bacterium]